MIAENLNQDVETIEEYTLFSLDRSIDGLDMLLEDARLCSDEIDAGRQEKARRILHSLVSNLHSFDTFEYQVCSLFQVQTGRLTDADGSLQEAEQLFRRTLQLIIQRLEADDMAGLAGTIRNRLSPALGRFKTLLPVLRNHIRKNYVEPEA